MIAIRLSALAFAMSATVTLAGLGRPPSVVRLPESVLASIHGADQNKPEYESNCAYTSLQSGQVAWRDCNGQPNNTECVICEGGFFGSWDASGKGATVYDSGLTKNCGATALKLKVGKCVSGTCKDYGDPVPGGCSGSPKVYLYQTGGTDP
jgi:hypothetical protein